jgi:hypothetical protein
MSASSSNSILSRLKTPDQLNVSDKGEIKHLVDDVKAMGHYVDVLIDEGPWTGLNKPNVPIGTSEFSSTNTFCDVGLKSCGSYDTSSPAKGCTRYIYNDSIPKGTNKSIFFGLIDDIEGIIIPAIKGSDSTNKCQLLDLIVTQPNGDQCYEKRAVNVNDIPDIDSCMFKYDPKDPNAKSCKKPLKPCVNNKGDDCINDCPIISQQPDNKSKSDSDNQSSQKENFSNKYNNNIMKLTLILLIILFLILLLYLIK